MRTGQQVAVLGGYADHPALMGGITEHPVIGRLGILLMRVVSAHWLDV